MFGQNSCLLFIEKKKRSIKPGIFSLMNLLHNLNFITVFSVLKKKIQLTLPTRKLSLVGGLHSRAETNGRNGVSSHRLNYSHFLMYNHCKVLKLKPFCQIEINVVSTLDNTTGTDLRLKLC